jgi:hypothetical protein
MATARQLNQRAGPSPLNDDPQLSDDSGSLADEQPTSIADEQPTSIADEQPTSIADEASPSEEANPEKDRPLGSSVSHRRSSARLKAALQSAGEDPTGPDPSPSKGFKPTLPSKTEIKQPSRSQNAPKSENPPASKSAPPSESATESPPTSDKARPPKSNPTTKTNPPPRFKSAVPSKSDTATTRPSRPKPAPKAGLSPPKAASPLKPRAAAEPQPPAKSAKRAKDNKPTTPPRTAKEARNREASRGAAVSACRSVAASIWGNALGPLLAFITGIVTDALYFLRPFLGMALALSMVGMLLWVLTIWACAQISGAPGIVGTAAQSLVSGSCNLPVLSHAPWCRPEKPKQPAKQPLAELKTLAVLQNSFWHLVDIVEGGDDLPLLMHLGRSKIGALRFFVQHRTDFKNKTELFESIHDFVKQSRVAAHKMSTFNSHIYNTVDRIGSMTYMTRRMLDNVQIEPEPSLVDHLVYLLPGSPPRRRGSERLKQQYLRHAGAMSERLGSLIYEGTLLDKLFVNLNNSLDEIRNTTEAEAGALDMERDEIRKGTNIFAQLWVQFGMRSEFPERITRNIEATNVVLEAHGNASFIINLAIVSLRTLQNDVDDLRDRVTRDSKSWDSRSIDPVEIELILRIMQEGVDKMKRKKQRVFQSQMERHEARKSVNGEKLIDWIMANSRQRVNTGLPTQLQT